MRGQVSVEYIAIVAISIGLVAGGVLYYSVANNAEEASQMGTQIDAVGKQLVATVKETYMLGYGAREQITVEIPNGVARIYVSPLDNSELIVEYDTKWGRSEAVFFSDVPMATLFPDGNLTNAQDGTITVQFDSYGTDVAFYVPDEELPEPECHLDSECDDMIGCTSNVCHFGFCKYEDSCAGGEFCNHTSGMCELLPCVLNSASWNMTYAVETIHNANLTVYGTNCDGRDFEFTLFERDISDDEEKSTTPVQTFVGNTVTYTTGTQWECDGDDGEGRCLDGNPEFVFRGRLTEDIANEIWSSNELEVERKPPFCGDMIVQPTEECDDGNDVDNDACTNTCTLASCGDGIVQSGEECDRGPNNADTCAFCTTSCTISDEPLLEVTFETGFTGTCGEVPLDTDGAFVDDDTNPSNTAPHEGLYSGRVASGASLTYENVIENLYPNSGTISFWFIADGWEMQQYLTRRFFDARFCNMPNCHDQEIILDMYTDHSGDTLHSRFNVSGVVATGNLVSLSGFPRDVWQHYAAAWDEVGGLRIYLNGNLVGDNPSPVTIDAATYDIRFSNSTDVIPTEPAVHIDVYRIYGKALSQSRVEEIYCEHCTENCGICP